jgi:SAM-dependent methyltransferase
MSTFYKIAYMIGMTSWEDMAKLPIARQISGLLDRERQTRQAPYGRVLDLGCGSGNWSIDLARRGWQVTGLDKMPKAIRTARKRSGQAGMEVQFVQEDLTDFGPEVVGSGFEFLLDFGALHGLNLSQRHAVGRSVNSVALPAPPC